MRAEQTDGADGRPRRGGRVVALGRLVGRRTDALVFAGAGLCTVATVSVVVDRDLASVASMLGSMLTLAGLFILGFGPADERPLRRVPTAQALLMAGAVAGLLQATALGVRGDHRAEGLLAVVIPWSGLVGGVAVGAAVVALVAARARHAIRTVTLVGLGIIAVSALGTNGIAIAADHVLLVPTSPSVVAWLVHASVICSGIGQLVIAVGFWRHPLR